MAGNILNQPTLVDNPFEVGTTTQPKNQTSIVSNVLNRNSDVGRLLSQTDIFKKPSEEELLRVKKEYDNATSWSNYLIGSQQLINKMASDGLLSYVLPDELQQDAAYAYRDNQRELEKVRDYRTRLGMSNAGLSASEIAPELAVELGLLIPAAGQVGAGLKAIGAADKLSKLGRAGKVIEEATKWGLAEAPVSALLGHRDEMGQRMAMSALGAGVIEGVIQGVGAVANKIRGSELLKKQESVIPKNDALESITSNNVDEFPYINVVGTGAEIKNADGSISRKITKDDIASSFADMARETNDFENISDNAILKKIKSLEDTREPMKRKYPLATSIHGSDGSITFQQNILRDILEKRKGIHDRPQESTLISNPDSIFDINEIIFEKNKVIGNINPDGSIKNQKVYDRIKAEHMQPESSTINEVPKEGTNTPEMPIVKNKPIPELNSDISKQIDNALEMGEATKGVEALASKAESGYYDSLSSHLGSSSGTLKVSDVLRNMSSGKYKDLTKDEINVAKEFENLHLKRKVDYDVNSVDTMPTGRAGQSVMGVDENINKIVDRRIDLNPQKTTNSIFLHEVAHQQSAEFIETAKMELSKGLKTKNTQAYNDLFNLMYKVDRASGVRAYGFKNVDEFVSEAFSNKEFQDILKAYKINKNQSMWDRFVAYIKNLLGLKSDNDALSKVISISKERFEATFDRGLNTNKNEIIQPFERADIKATADDVNKIVSEGIDRISGFVVDSAKNLYANPNIKSFIGHGLDLAKIAKDTMSELANKNKFTKALKNSFAMPDESIGSFMQNLNVLVDKSMKAKMFVQLAKLTAKGEKTSIEVGNSIRSYIKQMMSDIPEAKELREAFTKHYLYTDFQSIKDLGIKTMSDARKYIADNRAVYDKFKKEIDQGAKALKDRGEMNSKYYYDNAYAIAKSKKVDDPKTIDTIDKLISVKSLNEKDLAFINRYSHENWFGEMSDMAHSFANESKNIFKSNPYHQVKGYYKEVYGKDLYSHDFDIDGIDHKSLKIFDRAEYTKGALPVNPNKRSIGSKIADLAELKSQDENVVNAAKERIESFDGRLRTVRSSTGEVLSWNRVLPESRRINELNKNLDSADILASSYQSLYKKRGVEEAVNFLKSDKDGVLLEYVENGKYPKSGYVPLSEKDLSIIDKRLLPEEGKTLYVPQNFKHMMVGNEAIGFTEAKSFQNSFMNIMKDATDHFKHSVIIANARAYLVNYVGSYTAALRAGMKHSEIMSSFREANSLYKAMRQDLNEFYIKSTTGRSTASVEARLKANPLFQMKDNGLSLTMVHDYMAHTGSRSLSHDLAETGLQKLYKFLGVDNQHPLKYKDILGLEDGTKGGEIASLVMARFDVYGRYAIVKKALSSGKSMDEAVNEANSIFGDSNMITPRIIQALDSVPALPFANWMFKVFSGNVKAIKENFTQSLGIYLMFKSLSALTGYNLNSGDSNQIPLSPIQAMDRYDVSKQIGNVNPAHPLPYMEQAGKLFEEGNPLSVLFSKNQ